jgi:hypothetical protein
MRHRACHRLHPLERLALLYHGARAFRLLASGTMSMRPKKFTVILATALGALAAAAFHAVIVWPEMAAQTRGLDPTIAEWVRKPMMFETCIIFFTAAYYLGRTLSRRIGDFRSSAMLKAQGSAHLRLLHAVGGTLIIVCRYFLHSYYGAPAWQNGLMICFGAFLVVKSLLKSPTSRPGPRKNTMTGNSHDAR